MDANQISHKSKADAIHCIEKIAGKRFDQETLQVLLTAIRQCAPNGTYTREIGDFIAHPDRNKGIILNHLNQYKAQSLFTPGKTVIRMMLPMPVHGKCLVEDLVKVVASIGLDAKPIQENHNDLTICYFGLLHLTTIRFDKANLHTLKISDKHYFQKDGTALLSIISVVPNTRISHIFYIDINSKSVLGDLVLDDFDVKTVLRTVRDGGSLKIIKC